MLVTIRPSGDATLISVLVIMFPRIILCCLFFFASGNRISNSQSVTSELYLLTQSPHHLKLFAPGSTPLQCTAGNCSTVCRPRSKSGLGWHRTSGAGAEGGVSPVSGRRVVTRLRHGRERWGPCPEWRIQPEVRSDDTIHLTHSLLLSQNKYSPLGSEKKLWYSSLPPAVILEFSQKSNPVFVVSFLLVKSLDINLESKCSSILQQHLSDVQWTNPIATDWNFWLRNNPSVVLRMVDNWINIWLSKVHPPKRQSDKATDIIAMLPALAPSEWVRMP